MPRTLRLRLTMDRHAGLIAPAARFWVDLNADLDFQNTERVDAEQDGMRWTAELDVPDHLEMAFVLCRYVATPGAKLVFEALVDGSTAKEATRIATHASDYITWQVPLGGPVGRAVRR